MPTQPQLIPQPAVSSAVAPQMAGEAELVQSSAASAAEDGPHISAKVARLPVEIDVSIPIREFRVRDLLILAEGAVIASQWVQGVDLPLAAPGAQLAWTEFEVIDQRLAVRITRLV